MGNSERWATKSIQLECGFWLIKTGPRKCLPNVLTFRHLVRKTRVKFTVLCTQPAPKLVSTLHKGKIANMQIKLEKQYANRKIACQYFKTFTKMQLTQCAVDGMQSGVKFKLGPVPTAVREPNYAPSSTKKHTPAEHFLNAGNVTPSINLGSIIPRSKTNQTENSSCCYFWPMTKS